MRFYKVSTSLYDPPDFFATLQSARAFLRGTKRYKLECIETVPLTKDVILRFINGDAINAWDGYAAESETLFDNLGDE